MRSNLALTLCLASAVALISNRARAEEIEDESPAFLGLMFDAGVPDGVQGALVFRPWSFVRAHVGGGYNLVSGSIRGGITLTPIDTVVRPILVAELGRYFDGDLSTIDRLSGSALKEMRGTRIGYDWVNAQVGLEVDWGGGALSLQGGLTKVWADITPSVEGADMMSFGESPHLNVLAPSAKIAFISWFD